MPTARKKNPAVKRSVSAPKSLWRATDEFLDQQMPPVSLSRHIQELVAKDLRSRGLLNGKATERAS